MSNVEQHMRPLKRVCIDSVSESKVVSSDSPRKETVQTFWEIIGCGRHSIPTSTERLPSPTLVGNNVTAASTPSTYNGNVQHYDTASVFKEHLSAPSNDRFGVTANNLIPSKGPEIQVCFGMVCLFSDGYSFYFSVHNQNLAHAPLKQLDDIPIEQTRPNVLEPDAVSIEVSIDTQSERAQLQTDGGLVLGSIDSHCTKIFRVLQIEEAIEYQAYVVVSPLQGAEIGLNRNKYGRRQTSQLQVKTCTLCVIWYGPMDRFEDIGSFFSKCAEYLQSPLRCDRNVPYRNPQSLSGRDGNPPMTHQLQAELSHSEFETLMQGADPSAALRLKALFQKQNRQLRSEQIYTGR